MHSEDRLIKNAVKGDHKAFRQIVETYQRYVFAIILNITHDPQETENIVQETFIQVYYSLSQYRFKGFKTWIGRIAVNKAIDWKRKKKKEEERQLAYLNEITKLDERGKNTVEDEFIRSEEVKKMMVSWNKLPPKYRDILTKYFLQSKSYQQIALEEGISVRTVETRLYRAKQMLREHWKEGERGETL